MPRHAPTGSSEIEGRGTAYLPAVLAAVLAGLLFLIGLGHRPLTDWDEGIYAEIAREMLAGHGLQDFLAPHWNGHLWFEKPPLQMWLTAGSLRLFGLNAFAARLPSALAGMATVAILHAWLQRRFAPRTAWLGSLVLLSAFGFQHVARVGETDTLLALFCLVALLGLAELLLDHGYGWLLFWLGFGLALMTKGAASLPLPLTAIVVAAMAPRALLRHSRLSLWGAALFLLLVLPWHLYAYTQFGKAFVGPYLGLHVLQRATTALEGHRTHGWFYLWVLLISAPLFSFVYPVALFASFRRADLAPLRPLSVFAAADLLLFSLARTRLPHYIAPAYPPFAALTAAWLGGWLWKGERPGLTSRPIPWGRLASSTAALFALATAVTQRPRRSLHTPELRNGYKTPDNREDVALLQQMWHAERPDSVPPGPLLVWQQTPVVPVTTDAFYGRRLVQQVSLSPPPADLARDPYFNDPQPLGAYLGTPHLVLLHRSLEAQVPAGAELIPMFTGPTQVLALLRPVPGAGSKSANESPEASSMGSRSPGHDGSKDPGIDAGQTLR